MPVLTAATTEETSPAEDTGGDPGEMLTTAIQLFRLWVVAVFSTIVFAATIMEVSWMADAPGGYLYFWGGLMLLGGYYATTRTPDVLNRT